MDIVSIGSIQPPTHPEMVKGPAKAPPAKEKGSVTFSDLLEQVVRSEGAAERASQEYATGKTQNVHETMLALQKADITLRLAVTVRNKLIDAYQTVMRMS